MKDFDSFDRGRDTCGENPTLVSQEGVIRAFLSRHGTTAFVYHDSDRHWVIESSAWCLCRPLALDNLAAAQYLTDNVKKSKLIRFLRQFISKVDVSR